MNINTNRIKVSGFSAELEKELDPNLRTFVTVETEIYERAYRDNQDGTHDQIFKSKLVGSTIVQQQGDKVKQVCKSKRSHSKRFRGALWTINPEDGFYEVIMEKLINNPEEVIEFLKDK